MKDFTFLGLRGDCTTLLQRKKIFSRPVLKPFITIGWVWGLFFIGLE